MQATKKQEISRKEIMEACLSCKGHGCKICASKVERINAWSIAGIPVLYWTYELNTFPGNEHFKKYLLDITAKIDATYKYGKSLAFTGKYGVGKTSGACEILKAAIAKGYTARYTTMSEIVDMVLSKEERFDFKYALLHCDFLVIDEFDARYVPTTDRGKEMFGTNLENIIRTRIQNLLPIIFCTNNSNLTEVFDGTFGLSFDSLFSNSNVSHIVVGGVYLR